MRQNTDTLVRLLKRLVFARATFEEIKSMCALLEQQPPRIDKPWHRVAFCGICAGYARPFLRGDGLGPLPDQYRVFDNPDQTSLHDDLVHGRHWLFAHQDTLNAQKLVDPAYGLSIGQVGIDLQPGKGPRYLTLLPVLLRERLNAIATLCALQVRRIEEDEHKTFRLLVQGRQYKPGRYTLGVDFP